jgi:hypothetical protein
VSRYRAPLEDRLQAYEDFGPPVPTVEQLRARLGDIVERRFGALQPSRSRDGAEQACYEAIAAVNRYALDPKRWRGAAAEMSIAEANHAVRLAEEADRRRCA